MALRLSFRPAKTLALRLTTMKSEGGLLLLLEDQAIIAMSLQDDFEQAGYEVIGPFSTCEAASSWLESHTPDVAVLDAKLRDGSCEGIAAELSRHGIPFIVYSGYREDKNITAVWIEKPAPTHELLAGLRRARLLLRNAISSTTSPRVRVCSKSFHPAM
jgi:DNA-binding response OmpR family regulator